MTLINKTYWYVHKQAYLKGIDAKMIDGGEHSFYFERMSLTREKLAEVGIVKPHREANLKHPPKPIV